MKAIAQLAMLEFIAQQSNRPITEVRELWTERAAIREFVGGIDRAEAERQAILDVATMLGVSIS